jgi:hypothetical protein
MCGDFRAARVHPRSSSPLLIRLGSLRSWLLREELHLTGELLVLVFSKFFGVSARPAIATETRVLAPPISERESTLRALYDAPTDGLAELRGVFLGEHEWRVREGLV